MKEHLSSNLTQSREPIQPPEVGVSPQHSFWPLPPAGQAYWWKYTWSDGRNYRCTGPLPAGTVGLVAQNLRDGAFRSNQAGYESLISISFFKAVDCTYWFPNRKEILRWYCRGFRPWSADGKLFANILSFRGHSRWCMNRRGSTLLKKNGAVAVSINGRYTVEACYDPNVNHRYPSPPLVNGTRYGNIFFDGEPSFADNLPPYPVLPDRPLNLDLRATTNYRLLGGGESGWRYTRECAPTGEPCTGIDRSFTWFTTWKEVPSYTYRGKRVQYAGFSEVGLLDNFGPCEEWWFAEDIGPIYVIAYPDATLAQAQALLYGTSVFPNTKLEQSPEAHIQRRLDSMRGTLTLSSHCIDSSGSVEY